MNTPSGLDIKLLRMLVAIDRHGSLTRAASALGLTQSALSHHIKEAERRMAVVLFHRVGKRLHPTGMGEELLQAAKGIVGEIERIEGELDLYRQGYGPVVRIASGAYGCQGWLPAFLAELAAGGARYDVEILDNGSAAPLPNSVIDGAVDVAIFGGEVADRRLRAHHLFADELVALLPAGHRLAAKRHLEAADFADEVFLSYSTVPERGLEDHRFFRPAKANPRRWIRAGNVEMIVEMVRRGLGVSILSRWAIEPLLAGGGLALACLTGAGLPANWHAIVRASELKDSAPAELAECLAAWCRREFPALRGAQPGAHRTFRPH
jgi:LysR family transcriptional regulator, regulator for metE and metH